MKFVLQGKKIIFKSCNAFLRIWDVRPSFSLVIRFKCFYLMKYVEIRITSKKDYIQVVLRLNNIRNKIYTHIKDSF